MNESARTVAILADIAPALEASRRVDGYYPALTVVRDMIAARHDEQAANTVYHGGAGILIQRHSLALYSAKGAREFASIARKTPRQPLQNFNWFGAHASPFITALDWLYFRLERLTVGDVINVRSDLMITRTDESAFRVRYGARTMPVHGADYAHSCACLLVALLFGGTQEKSARRKPSRAQSGIVAVV